MGRKKKERAKKTSTKKPKEKRVKMRKTVRARKKRKEMIKNFVNFLLSPNLVISYYIYQIRHLIIISALDIKQEEIDCVSSKKKPKSNARNARPIPIKKRPNIRYKAKKKKK